MFSNTGWKLKPETAADVEQESTIQGKRQRIYRHSRENPLTHALLRQSEAMGLSGEDTMTWLAYESLKRIEQLEEHLIEFVNTNPTPPMFTAPAPTPEPR